MNPTIPSVSDNSAFESSLMALSEKLLLWSRYILVPFYVGLVLATLTIAYDFFMVLIGHAEGRELVEHAIKMISLLDMTMVANFIWLIAAGSFYVFVDNRSLDTTKKERPHSLTHVSAGLLKEKMAGSIIGVSLVSLVDVFLSIKLDTHPVDWNKLAAMLAIIGVFTLVFLAFSYVNGLPHHNHNKAKQENGHP